MTEAPYVSGAVGFRRSGPGGPAEARTELEDLLGVAFDTDRVEGTVTTYTAAALGIVLFLEVDRATGKLTLSYRSTPETGAPPAPGLTLDHHFVGLLRSAGFEASPLHAT